MSGKRRRHTILNAFYTKRTDNVVGTQQLQGVRRGDLWNLHGQDPHRSVTWFDEVENVVFLLGHTVHDYSEFVDRYFAGELMPTDADYEDFRRFRAERDGLNDDFIDAVEDEAGQLVADALAQPGILVSRLLGHELPADALLDALEIDGILLDGDVYVVLRVSKRRNSRDLPADLVSELIAVLLPPEAEFEHIEIHCAAPDQFGNCSGDIAVRWRRPS